MEILVEVVSPHVTTSIHLFAVFNGEMAFARYQVHRVAKNVLTNNSIDRPINKYLL